MSNNISFKDLKEFFKDRFGISENKVMIVPVTGDPELGVQQHILEEYKDDELFTIDDTYILSAFYHERQSDLFCTTGFSSLCIMPNGDIYPCHMYASNRDYRLGNISMGFDFEFIKEKLNALPLGNKNTRGKCNSCWARKIFHLCPAKIVMSEKSENDLMSKSACGDRRKKIEDKLLKLIYD